MKSRKILSFIALAAILAIHTIPASAQAKTSYAGVGFMGLSPNLTACTVPSTEIAR